MEENSTSKIANKYRVVLLLSVLTIVAAVATSNNEIAFRIFFGITAFLMMIFFASIPKWG